MNEGLLQYAAIGGSDVVFGPISAGLNPLLNTQVHRQMKGTGKT